MRFLYETQWLYVDHASRLPKAGDWFLFHVGDDSIVINRDRDGQINALHNSCRHRGSLICLEDSGNSRMLVCPYHSWSYDLKGALRQPRYMPEGFDVSQNSLKACHVRVLDGLIFINLSASDPPDFEELVGDMRPFIEPHRVQHAKVAARRSYPMQGNWKLIVENFFECYHCRSAHQTYVSVHDSLKLIAFGGGPGSSDDDLASQYLERLSEWERRTSEKGHVTGWFSDSGDGALFRSASRLPISENAKSETIDGEPAAPLMGDLTEFDGGQTIAIFNPISTVVSNNDYTITFRFTPRGPMATDIELTWLVAEDAEEGKDYSVDRLIQVWDITTKEDKVVCEANQRGVLSTAYRPGVYSSQERRIADLVAWYVRESARY